MVRSSLHNHVDRCHDVTTLDVEMQVTWYNDQNISTPTPYNLFIHREKLLSHLFTTSLHHITSLLYHLDLSLKLCQSRLLSAGLSS